MQDSQVPKAPVTLIDEWEPAEATRGGVMLTLESMGGQVRLFLPPSVAGPLAGSIRAAAEDAMAQRASDENILTFVGPKDHHQSKLR